MALSYSFLKVSYPLFSPLDNRSRCRHNRTSAISGSPQLNKVVRMEPELKVGQLYPTIWGGTAKVLSISGKTVQSTNGYLYEWNGVYLKPLGEIKATDTKTDNAQKD